MAPLGLFFAWGGYVLFIYGYGKQKWGSAGGGGPTLSISDVALPSHRPAYLVAMNAYSTSSSGGSGGGTQNPSSGIPNASGTPATATNRPGTGVQPAGPG